MEISRGEIYFVDFDFATTGSEQYGGKRPAIIIQNDKGNCHSTTTIVAPLTSKFTKNYLPTHFYIEKSGKLKQNSIALLEQIKVIDKSKIICKLTKIDDKQIKNLNKCISISLGLL